MQKLMKFADLLRGEGIRPNSVLLLRHRPPSEVLQRLLPTFALERPDLFNAYQSTQPAQVEASMKKADYVASFIGAKPGEALFVGLYRVAGSRPISEKQFWALREHTELKPLGLAGFYESPARSSIMRFTLKLTDFYAHWKGKLVVQWSVERSRSRWADRGVFPIKAIYEECALRAPMPSWNELVLRYEELTSLPSAWKLQLANWRGIYFVFDVSDCKAYIGSAYGEDNLLGRWQNYAKGKNGGNKLLDGRDPKNFRFSILQIVSHDMPASEVITIEAAWKTRLHTRHPFGMNGN